MSKKVRVGFVGLGPRGRGIMLNYAMHPLCEVAALCDTTATMVDEALEKLGNSDVGRFTSFEAMLHEVSLDAVFIAVPPDFQVDLAVYAMEKGIHVSTEVPVACTIEQCWDLVKAVETSGCHYMPAEQMRYVDLIQKCRELSLNGGFGKILYAEGQYLHFHKWDYFIDPATGERFYGNAEPPKDRVVKETWRKRMFQHPIYYLPHTLSPLLSILDDRVVRVSCMGTRPESYHVPGLDSRDLEIALMHTAKDTVLKVACGFTSPHGHRGGMGKWHWYHVAGTEREVEWGRYKGDKPKMWIGEEEQWRDLDWSYNAPNVTELSARAGHHGLDWWPIHHFLTAVSENTDVPMNVYEAVETAAPAILAAESSREGGVLKEVPDFRNRAGRKGD